MDAQKILILWDVDGTLVEVGRGREDKHRQAVETVGACVVSEQTRQGGKTDLQIITEIVHEYELASETISPALKLLDQLTDEELQRKPLAATENAKSTLGAVAERGWLNGLLTGNTRARANAKLRSAGLLENINNKFFFDGELAQDRFHLSRSVGETVFRIGITRVVVVGDTPLDIQASHIAGFSCVAVATGSYGSEALAIHNPDLLIEDLSVGFDDLMSFIETRCEI